MLYRFAADFIVLVHLAFILFVIAGGLSVIRWQFMVWLHLPAAAWAALLEFNGWLCPLTPLENRFRALAGEQGYADGFIEHYLIPVIYPQGLTAQIQVQLGIAVVAINLLVYGYVIYGMRRR
ncbi:MAG TPA: DUF2784 domain-containing protein [Gammaproteobacteria bacterium]|jgi:hypothetical protein